MSATPTADRLRRQLAVWTVILGVVGVGLVVVGVSADFAEGGSQAVVIIIGVVGVALALVVWSLRIRLAYQAGRAGR